MTKAIRKLRAGLVLVVAMAPLPALAEVQDGARERGQAASSATPAGKDGPKTAPIPGKASAPKTSPVYTPPKGRRCAMPQYKPDLLADMVRLQVELSCRAIRQVYGNHWLEIPTELISSALAPKGAVTFADLRSGFTVKPTAGRSICRVSRRYHSIIPKHDGKVYEGSYHGAVYEDRMTYKWRLKRRSKVLGHGQTRLSVDIYVATIPTKLLSAGREAGVCHTVAQMRRTFIWRKW